MKDETTVAFHGTGRRSLLRPVRGLLAPRPESPDLPDRYRVREEKGERHLSCLDAPEIRVLVSRSTTTPGGTARKAPEGTIFLDGAAQSEPFLDTERRVMNLDHHQGCVRPFTLATCEQALALVMRGLDTREKPWTIHANDADLDTVLAIWVLLNAGHLERGGDVLRAAVPVVRLEGVIDAHGSELDDFSGFPAEQLAAVSRILEELYEPERAAKREGVWEEIDLLQFVARQLYAIDRHFFPPGYFAGFCHVEELARVPLNADRVAIACRSDRGIYELETDLKKVYGKRLGVIVLDKGGGAHTLRLVDRFLPATLEAAYDRLNLADPAVHAGDPSNKWGGAADIGGSPRKTGSKLSPREIADLLRTALRRRQPVEQLVAVGLAMLLLGGALAGLWLPLAVPELRLPARSTHAGALFLLSSSVAALLLAGRSRQRFYGLVPPRGRRWMWMLLPGAIGGLAGGAWTRSLSESGIGTFGPLVAVAAAIAAEVAFRGAAHGTLARFFRMSYPPSRWVPSTPVLIAAALYALVTPLLGVGHGGAPLPALVPGAGWLFVVPGALLVGLASGLARDRSGSVLASIAVHLAGTLAVALAS
ncbi:MAG TPA: CPBP family glutamic-type intramembrane protease [Thermoanaerobaculia bacterium]|nr:CPBP family glutamic-type intramembrane protease [Thermoanaerobaculia bacterium]